MRSLTFFSLAFLLAQFFVPTQGQAARLAAWVVRFDIADSAKVEAVCEQARQHDFDRLLVQVRGRADAYYQSRLVPEAEDVEPGFDPLAAVLAACDPIEIDAWLNVYYLWTGSTPPRDDRHPALRRTWLLRDSEERLVDTYTTLEQSQRWIEGIYADPASDAYRRTFTAAVVELVRAYPIKGIHLDFVRYPGAMFGAGGSLARDFEREYGLRVGGLPAEITRQDFAAWLNGSLSGTQRQLVTARLIWDSRRAAEVSKLVAMVRAALKKERPGMRLSVAVFPDPVEAFLDKGQDWPGWLRTDMVDELFVMNYFGDKSRVQALFDEVLQVVGRRDKLWLGLGTYIKSPTAIAEEIALCGGGGQAVCFFSLGHFHRQGKVLRDYVEAVRVPLDSSQVEQLPVFSTALPHALQEVSACLAAYEPSTCVGNENFLALVDRGGKASRPLKTGPWLDLRGIFRYVNPYDGLDKVVQQLELARHSHELLVQGHSFQDVSRLYSQAGSRHHGGVLPRFFLGSDSRLARMLADLEAGQFSPVIPVHNGFWVYQVLGKGGG